LFEIYNHALFDDPDHCRCSPEHGMWGLIVSFQHLLLAVLLIVITRSISFWSLFLTSFVSFQINNNADYFVVTTKPLLLLSSPLWGSRQRKTQYRCWYSKMLLMTMRRRHSSKHKKRRHSRMPVTQQKATCKKRLEQYGNLKSYHNEHGHNWTAAWWRVATTVMLRTYEMVEQQILPLLTTVSLRRS
jgi:hypothetical protein